MSSILIVEDNESLGRSLSVFLRSRGLTVAHAGSLSAAKAHLHDTPFDAVVLDVGLPDGSGLDLLAQTGTERAVVMTATPDADAFERHNVTNYLPKPFDLEELFRVLRRVAEA
jgi:DNA-binding NtrC family response regulator